MPAERDMTAATPKCPCARATGPTAQRCAEPMMWNSRRGVWVCNRHPHMQVAPDDFERATMAPKADRTPIVMGWREPWL